MLCLCTLHTFTQTFCLRGALYLGDLKINLKIISYNIILDLELPKYIAILNWTKLPSKNLDGEGWSGGCRTATKGCSQCVALEDNLMVTYICKVFKYFIDKEEELCH